MASLLPPDESRGPKLVIVWWTEIGVASLFISLRIWARRYKRNLGFDDAFMIAAWLCYVADGIALQFSAINGGTRHFVYLTMAQQQYQRKLVVVALDIGIACTSLGKIAIGITLLRIIGDTSRWQKWAVTFTVALTAGTGIVDILITTFRCGNPENLWASSRIATAKCLDNKAVFDFNDFCNAWQVFNDFFFSLLPMVIVWNLRMPLRRKLQLGIGLGLTLITGIAGAIKTGLTSTVNQTDLTWNLFHTLIWFGTEAMLIIVCGSVPALYPLWERFVLGPRPEYGSSAEREYRSQKYSNLSAKNTASTTISQPGISSNIELTRLTGTPSQEPASVLAASPGHGENWLHAADDRRIHVVDEVNVSSGN